MLSSARFIIPVSIVGVDGGTTLLTVSIIRLILGPIDEVYSSAICPLMAISVQSVQTNPSIGITTV